MRLALTRAAPLAAPLLAALMLFAPLRPGHADTPQALLQAALAEAGPGSTIALPQGDYGLLRLQDLSFPPGRPLVLRSADPAHPASFSEMKLIDVQGLVLEGLVFDYRFTAGSATNALPFQVVNSGSVTIRASLFDGDVARGLGPPNDGAPAGYGLFVRRSRDIGIEGNEFRGFKIGLLVSETGALTVAGNDLHDLRMDAMEFAQIDGGVIEANHIHDFRRAAGSADHPDMIQFWTSGTTAPSRDITIRGNLLNSGTGGWTQSIFIRNELVDQGQAGTEMFYRNFTIADNFILNAHVNGISVGEVDGLIIANNSVLRNPRSEGGQNNPGLYRPQIRVSPAARNVAILRNLTDQITGPQGQADWRVEANMLVQDHARMEPGFYGTVFGPRALSDPGSPASFAPLPGGPLDGAGIGAPLPAGN